MAYDAKPTLDDVILSARGDGDDLRIALHLRVAGDGFGDLVGEWQGDECRLLFEDGTFRRGAEGTLCGSDEVLAASVLAHASERGLETLVGFEKAILDVMPGAEEVACSIYEEQVEEPPYEGYDAVMGNDHLTTQRYVRARWEEPPNYFEPLIALTACAAATSTIALMTGVIVLPMRDPILLAKQPVEELA